MPPRVLAQIPSVFSLIFYKLEKEGYPYIHCYRTEVEMEDKEQWGGGGVATESCCPQAREHFLHYTSVSLPCFFPPFLPQVTAGDIKGISSPLTSTSFQLTRSVSS